MTIVSLVYVAISLTVGDGIDIEAGDEKGFACQNSCYVCGCCGGQPGNQASSGSGGGKAVERERALERERVELSRAIHDTAAQSAYMIGLGIDTAKGLAGEANPELNRHA